MSRLVDLYGKYHVSPQFESLGGGPVFMGARYLHVYGSGVNVGNNATFVATSDSYIRLTTWNLGEFDGKIIAGDNCLFTPGVRIAAASEIKIGDGCMFANSGTSHSTAIRQSAASHLKPRSRMKPWLR